MSLVCSGIVNLIYSNLTIAHPVGQPTWLLGVRFRNTIWAWMLVQCASFVLRRYRHLRRADHLYRGVLPGVCVCVCLIVCDLEISRIRCTQGLNWAVGRHKNKVNTRVCALIRNESPRTHFRTVSVTFSFAICTHLCPAPDVISQ